MKRICRPENFLDEVVLAHDGDEIAGKRLVLLLLPYVTVSLDVPIYLWREGRSERCIKVCSHMERKMISTSEYDISPAIVPGFASMYLGTDFDRILWWNVAQ